jgi:uroporphyrinogen decarboxylase
VTPRERFLAIVSFERPDYVPYWYAPGIGITYSETVTRWRAEESYPSDYDSLVDYWGADGYCQIGLHTGFVPDFPVEVSEARDGWLRIRQHKAARRERTNNWDICEMPRFESYMFEDRSDWEQHMRPRLDPRDPARGRPTIPANERDEPVSIACPSMIGIYREWFGLERLGLLLHDDPKLIHEMNRACTDLFLEQASWVAERVHVDAITGWEDICFRGGMLLSPAAFEGFCAPYYREVVAFAMRIGAAVVDVDCDGDVSEFVHCLWRAGVNMCHAFEPTHGGSDILRIGRELPRFVICGGLDKYAMLSPDPRDGVAEVDAKVPAMLTRGGYLPSIDHSLPPQAHYRTFWHFMNRIRELCGAPPARFQEDVPG